MIIRIELASQNEPLTLKGLKFRESSKPIEKGKSILSIPPRKFIESKVQPTPILPYPDASKTANAVYPIPRETTMAVSSLVERRRTNNA